MESGGGRAHWDRIYANNAANAVSWFQDNPAPSLELIAAAGATPATKVIDVGGGASRLVDSLLGMGFHSLTVLDVSAAALDAAKTRLGAEAKKVRWLVADATAWEPPAAAYDLWHDRAAFHFLTDERDRTAYVARLIRAVRPGGHAIIATFAPDGPERCSGLPVVRYDGQSLGRALGNDFELIETRRHEHRTPQGVAQPFQFALFRGIHGRPKPA
jgi:ubiquinone/menaquinone biosynthesis C-methylase UbiE